MIGSAAVFVHFVLHDLRLGRRRLASMFGALPPRNLGIVVTLLFAALHAAAWPVAGWFARIEGAPGGEAQGRDDSRAAASRWSSPGSSRSR